MQSRAGRPDIRRRSRARWAASAAFLALVIAGCGGGDGNQPPATPQQLSAEEQSAVRTAQREIQSYCRELTLYLARRRGAPTETETGRAYAAVDRLAEIARSRPGAPQRRSATTVRELLGLIAEDLEGSNCAPNVEQRISQALATLPDR